MNSSITGVTPVPPPTFVTPSLVDVAPERLPEVIREYREQLQELAVRRSHHCCAWALEAIDTLLGERVRLQRTVDRLTAEIPVREPKRRG